MSSNSKRADIFDEETSTGGTLLTVSIESLSLECVMTLIKIGVDVNKKAVIGGNAPIILAAIRGHNRIVHELISAGARVDESNNQGRTALMKAAEYNQVHTVVLLLDSGCSISKADRKGNTALHVAAQRGFYEVAEVLLRHAAPQHLRNINEKTALELCSGSQATVARLHRVFSESRFPLHYCVQHGSVRLLGSHLDGGVQPIEAQDHDGRTALLHAILHRKEVSKSLSRAPLASAISPTQIDSF